VYAGRECQLTRFESHPFLPVAGGGQYNGFTSRLPVDLKVNHCIVFIRCIAYTQNAPGSNIRMNGE
jgi:hypothetical protein